MPGWTAGRREPGLLRCLGLGEGEALDREGGGREPDA